MCESLVEIMIEWLYYTGHTDWDLRFFPLSFIVAMNWTTVKAAVQEKIGDEAYSSLLSYLKDHTPALWGEDQPRTFLEKANAVALYKDLHGVGYCKLEATLAIGITLHHNSLSHNQKVLRLSWKNWALQHIQLGVYTDWKAAVRHLRVTKRFPLGMLWEDSSDIAIQRGKGRGKSSPWWSWKLNRPGCCYMTLVDGKCRARKVWRGYSPKIYDGQFVSSTEEWYHEKLGGAGVFADQHFAKATRTWKDPVFYCPYRLSKDLENEDEAKIRSDDEEGEDVEMVTSEDNPHGEGAQTLTAKQRGWNKALHKMRAKVEIPYGQVKSKWKALDLPWPEDLEQLDCVVFTAFAVWNFSRN